MPRETCVKLCISFHNTALNHNKFKPQYYSALEKGIGRGGGGGRCEGGMGRSLTAVKERCST